MVATTLPNSPASELASRQSTPAPLAPFAGNIAGWPAFTAADGKLVADVLCSNRVNYWTGNRGKLFEQAFAEAMHCEYGIAMANGTVVLEAALKSLGVGAGDEVIVTSRSFMASVACVVTVGATPVFSDVDRDSQNITADTIAPLITSRTRAIIPVHLAGWPCDMPAIVDLASSHGIAVIEDCAQAHGAMFDGQSVGSFGDVGCWSFCQDKIMTTGGEGGAVATNREDLWRHMWSMKDHGKPVEMLEPDFGEGHPPGFRWLHGECGTNWRMTEMQAALGQAQLSELGAWVENRRRNAHAIWEASAQTGKLRVPDVPENVLHAAYRCTVFCEPDALKSGWSRDRLIQELGALGVLVNQGSCPEIYREKAFQGLLGDNPTRLPVAHELGATSLTFQVHPNLSSDYIGYTAEAIAKVMASAAR